jgi:hypothetical protein
MRKAVRLAFAIAATVPGGCKVAPLDDNAIARAPVVRDPTGGAPLPSPAPDGGVGALPGSAERETTKHYPLGFAGAVEDTPGVKKSDETKDSVPVPDRWRIGFPAWERGSTGDSPYDMSSPVDPYHQNVLKGDYPLPGTQNTFLSVEMESVTRVEAKKLPVPSSVFTRSRGDEDFFGNGRIQTAEQLGIVTLDLFQGETAFKPVDWRILVKGVVDGNWAHAGENTALYADPARGRTRTDRHGALQECFGETTLASIDDKYDVVQLRVGTQKFNSDFRGFLFDDEAPGVRLFGNFDDNLWQWNLAYFDRLNKDTNSGLNTFDLIGQRVFIANVFRQDFLTFFTPTGSETTWNRGLTSQLSFHHLDADPSVHYDENGFLVRPRLVGTPQLSGQNVNWVGWTNDGHIGRVNVTSALYGAWGTVGFDEVAGRRQDVEAKLAALELSYDKDWMRFRVQGLYQSGDRDPTDGRAEGFDGVFDDENFAGGEFSFWNRNAIALTGSGVGLTQGHSLYNTLRSSKIEGAPSFVNPGLLLFGVGFDAQITPNLKVVTNASHLRFADTASVEYVLGQGSIHDEIGEDLSVGVVWRPLLTENVIVKSGVSALIPGRGFRDIYGADTLYAVFTELVITW